MPFRVPRRAFLAGALASLAVPAWGEQRPSGDVDVAIVGAGVAGIAAARRVAMAGRSYALLEASDRIGGRVFTASGGLGIRHDRGAHRLNAPDRNPLVALAQAGGMALYEPSRSRRLQVGAREARDGEYDDFTAAARRARRAIAAAGETGRDASAAGALPDLGDWRATTEFLLGPLTCSKDLEQVSTVDFARAEERPDDIGCRDGVGAIVMLAARGLAISTGAPVHAIDASGRRQVVVETGRGNVRADAVIVTASTNVLASEQIKFRPPLPARVAEAIQALSLGTHDRLVFELPGNPLKLRDDQPVLFKTAGRRTIALVGRIAGSDLAYAEFAGSFGAELSRQGPAAMGAFLRETLTEHFGATASRWIGRSEVVRWSQEPYIRGGVSVASPGKAGSRQVIATPVHDRIYFAGEATHATLWGTVAGAWLAGERAADQVIRRHAPPAPAPSKSSRKRN